MSEIPSAAFHPYSEIVWHHNTIRAVGGRVYNDVRYRRKDLDRLWPSGSIRPGARQKPSQETVNAWVLNYGTERQAEGRKVNLEALKIEAREAIGATERQTKRARRDVLPKDQKYKRGERER